MDEPISVLCSRNLRTCDQMKESRSCFETILHHASRTKLTMCSHCSSGCNAALPHGMKVHEEATVATDLFYLQDVTCRICGQGSFGGVWRAARLPADKLPADQLGTHFHGRDASHVANAQGLGMPFMHPFTYAWGAVISSKF